MNKIYGFCKTYYDKYIYIYNWFIYKKYIIIKWIYAKIKYKKTVKTNIKIKANDELIFTKKLKIIMEIGLSIEYIKKINIEIIRFINIWGTIFQIILKI